MLSPMMGTSSFLFGTTMVNSLIECLIAMIGKLGSWNVFEYFSSTKHAKIIITDHYRVSQMSCLILETHSEIVLEYQDSCQNQILVKSVRSGAEIMISGVACKIGITKAEPSASRHDVADDQPTSSRAITITYPKDEITANEIANAIVSYQPRQTYLRIYHPRTDKEGKCTWEQKKDISKSNASNTFFTEQVQTQFVDDVNAFVSSFILGTSLEVKRSYLLHGKPGAGKTSIIPCILGSHKIFSIPNQMMRKRETFEEMVSSITKYVTVGEIHVVVLDEVDKCYWDCRMLGPLCSFLDGLMPNAGRIVVMTGNEIGYFDRNPVLVRPGRISKVIEISCPDDQQLRRTITHERPDWELPTEALVCTLPIAEVIQKLREPETILSDLIQSPDDPEVKQEAEDTATGSKLDTPTLPAEILLERLQVLEERFVALNREEMVRNRIILYNGRGDQSWTSNACMIHSLMTSKEFLVALCSLKYCRECCLESIDEVMTELDKVRDHPKVIAYLLQEPSVCTDPRFRDPVPEPE